MTTRRDFLKIAASASLAGPLSLLTTGQRQLKPAGQQRFVGREVFDRIVAHADARGWRKLPIGDLMGRIALELRGTPYVGGTLELPGEEACSVNLLGLDCVSLFESSLGIARMLKLGGRTPGALLTQVTLTRYRGGRVAGYPSRLHYTTDWFHDNVRKGIVTLVAPALPGARTFEQRVGFMSAKPDLYRQLEENPSLVRQIAAQERQINSRRLLYVPKDKIAAAERYLRTGDIVGIATSAEGLDIAHTGLCYRDESGDLRFLHASSSKKRVVLDARLSEYVTSGGRNTGVMIARPREPRRAR